MDFFSQKLYLITGASMGIGESLARALAARRAKLILVARSADRLRALKKELGGGEGSIGVFPADLSKPGEVERLIRELKDAYPLLDGIILNAGVGLYGEFEENREEDIRELFEVNFFSNLALIQGLLPQLKLGNKPRLVFVSSVVSWRSIPRLAAYCASKAALNLFAEGLRLEVERYGIKVVNTYPGHTRTPFSENAKSAGWRPSVGKKWADSPEYVARKILRAVERGRREAFVSLTNRVVIWTNFIFPQILDWALARYFRNRFR